MGNKKLPIYENFGFLVSKRGALLFTTYVKMLQKRIHNHSNKDGVFTNKFTNNRRENRLAIRFIHQLVIIGIAVTLDGRSK
jgi:predicted GIY-YIG superfamily endonuclease